LLCSFSAILLGDLIAGKDKDSRTLVRCCPRQSTALEGTQSTQARALDEEMVWVNIFIAGVHIYLYIYIYVYICFPTVDCTREGGIVGGRGRDHGFRYFFFTF